MVKFLLQPADIYRLDGAKFSIDTETTGLEWWKDRMIGVGVYCPERQLEGYIPTYTMKEKAEVRKAILSLSPETTMIAHNLKFDFHFMGINPDYKPWTIIDTTVMVHLLDSRNKKSAEWCEEAFLGTTTKAEYNEERGRQKIWNMPMEWLAPYCINDCRVEYQFARTLAPALDKYSLWDLFWKDMEYLKVLFDAEHRGFWIDVNIIEKSMDSMRKHLVDLEQELWRKVGHEFNWRSHKQLSNVLYNEMNWPKPKNPFADADGVDRSRFADRGKYNGTLTSTLILTEKAKHPLGGLIATLRETHKLLGTMASWMKLKDNANVIHTNYNQTGTRTGRISSSEPNLQNVPSEFRGHLSLTSYSGSLVRSDEYNLRRAFRARPGYVLISDDWKQMEMRMFGIRSQDPFMLTSLAVGKDVHADVAERVWGVRDEAHREWSKQIAFGLIYGMTSGSLQFKLNLTRDAALKIVDDYWKAFPRVKPWLNDIVKECKRYGFIRYWSGRIWREEDESFMYKGANADIQGGCADVLSVAAIRIRQWLNDRFGKGATGIINLVHDEIIAEVPEEHLDECVVQLSTLMRVEDLFQIKWFNDPKIGPSYGELRNYDKPELIKDSLPQKGEKQVETSASYHEVREEGFQVSAEPIALSDFEKEQMLRKQREAITANPDEKIVRR